MYARMHQRLVDYSYKQAQLAHKTGIPIVKPLFIANPTAPEAWSNWWTFMYGPDIVVSPLWEKGGRKQEVYLPAGARWRDAWNPEKVYKGGQTISVNAELYQIPIFIRVGSAIQMGDLNKEYKESLEIAGRKPDLKQLDAELKARLEKQKADGVK
jgi:alpha-D-xyloside xylohydrolase